MKSLVKRIGARIEKLVETKPVAFTKGIFEYLGDHNWSIYSAGLSFYALLALTPFVVIAIAIGGAFFGDQTARMELYATVMKEAGPQVANLVVGFADGAANITSLSIASIVSAFVLLWSSTNLFTQVRSALHEAWGIEPPKETKGGLVGAIVKFLRYRLFAAIGTLVFGALFIALLALRLVLNVVADKTNAWLDVPIWIWDIVDIGVALTFITVFVRIVFRLLPDQSPKGWAPWIGGFATAILLVLGRTGVALYLSVGHVDSAYGAAGAIVVFLGWAYWSAFVFLFGARLTYALANLWGRWPEPQSTPMAKAEDAAPKKEETIASEADAGCEVDPKTLPPDRQPILPGLVGTPKKSEPA